jgi:hypothetical protein
MKTILIGLLLSILFITTNVPNSYNNEERFEDIDAIISKSEQNFAKASIVTQVADEQQKQMVAEIYETMEKLVEEKNRLEHVLTETKNELKIVKEIIHNNLVDSGEQFQLFPEN